MSKILTISILVLVVIGTVVLVLNVEPRVCRDFSRQKDAQKLFNRNPEKSEYFITGVVLVILMVVFLTFFLITRNIQDKDLAPTPINTPSSVPTPAVQKRNEPLKASTPSTQPTATPQPGTPKQPTPSPAKQVTPSPEPTDKQATPTAQPTQPTPQSTQNQTNLPTPTPSATPTPTPQCTVNLLGVAGQVCL